MWDLIGIDWGEKFFGIAKASSLTNLVIPYDTQVSSKDIDRIIAELLTDKNVKKVIVGYPTNLKLEKTNVTKKISTFIEFNQQKYPNVEFLKIYERGSSKQVDAYLKGIKYYNSNLSHHEVAMLLVKEYLKVA